MKLAVKKDGGELQGLGGYHYMLQPFELDDFQEKAYRMMRHVIIDVDYATGLRLLEDARNAMRHQVEVAILCEGVTPS